MTTGKTSTSTVAPIAHKGFKHLNKRITLLGFSPILGAILALIAIFLVVFSAAFKTVPLLLATSLYLPIYVYVVKKQIKSVKENRLDIFDRIFIGSKLVSYQDDTKVLHQIVKNED